MIMIVSNHSNSPVLSRYARQMRYPHLGEEGQRRLAATIQKVQIV